MPPLEPKPIPSSQTDPIAINSTGSLTVIDFIHLPFALTYHCGISAAPPPSPRKGAPTDTAAATFNSPLLWNDFSQNCVASAHAQPEVVTLMGQCHDPNVDDYLGPKRLQARSTSRACRWNGNRLGLCWSPFRTRPWCCAEFTTTCWTSRTSTCCQSSPVTGTSRM